MISKDRDFSDIEVKIANIGFNKEEILRRMNNFKEEL